MAKVFSLYSGHNSKGDTRLVMAVSEDAVMRALHSCGLVRSIGWSKYVPKFSQKTGACLVPRDRCVAEWRVVDKINQDNGIFGKDYYIVGDSYTLIRDNGLYYSKNELSIRIGGNDVPIPYNTDELRALYKKAVVEEQTVSRRRLDDWQKSQEQLEQQKTSNQVLRDELESIKAAILNIDSLSALMRETVSPLLGNKV